MDYKRWAREGTKLNDSVVYGKIGGKGKAKSLLKELGITVVPSFIMFVDGARIDVTLQTGNRKIIKQCIDCIRLGDVEGVMRVVDELETQEHETQEQV